MIGQESDGLECFAYIISYPLGSGFSRDIKRIVVVSVKFGWQSTRGLGADAPRLIVSLAAVYRDWQLLTREKDSKRPRLEARGLRLSARADATRPLELRRGDRPITELMNR